MSDEFASWCDGHGIKLELIPKAHHKLAIQERNHAVRRNQLLTFEKMYPLDSLKKAIAYTLAARNRLRNVKGYSPIQRVLGFQPHIPATLSDADYLLSEQSAASDPTSSLSQDLERRREAQKAFLDANFQQSVRRSLLARNRPARREYLVGETVYYWREKGENKDDTGLDVYHWHGPGVVCATEPPTNLDLSFLDRCYWIVHCSGAHMNSCAQIRLMNETTVRV